MECGVCSVRYLFVNVEIRIRLFNRGSRFLRVSRKSGTELAAGMGRHRVDGSPRPGKVFTSILIYFVSIVASVVHV